MTSLTSSFVVAGAALVLAGSLSAAVKDKQTADGLQTDLVQKGELQVGDGELQHSIITDEQWAQYPVVPNRVFVKFRAHIAGEGQENLLTEMDAEVSSSYERMMPHTYCLEIRGGVAEFLDQYRFRGDVLEYIEPVYVMEFSETIPNDSSWNSLYGMDNINAPAAWDTHVGNQEFSIAIIDSGSDPNHPDLADNLWQNPNEIPGNGVDDDGNGLIDDSYGWDFYDNDANPADQNGHGTHTAGTVGARGNNSIGVVGVNWFCSLMIFRVGDNSLSSQAILDSLQTACVNGAKVSNNSYGGGGFSSTFSNLILAAGNTYEHIFCAAAGNDGSSSASYPAAYPHYNIISVAATDANDTRASFSQYGSNVDIAAPGVNVLSTTPNNGYSSFSGTSMATPHVAGGVALLYSLMGNSNYEDIVDIIYDSVRVVPGLNGIVTTSGVLDVEAALAQSFLGPQLELASTIPSFIPAGEELTLSLNVDPRDDELISGSARLRINFGSGIYQSLPLVQTNSNLYEITLPPAECDWTPQFYFTVQGNVVGTMNLPSDGGLNPYGLSIGEEITVIQDDANANGQWTLGLPSDTATTGQWTRGNPIGTGAQPENAASGVNCFFTGQGTNGGGLGENDIDGGITTLISPTFDGTAVTDSVISYRRWYSNDTGASPNIDVMEIDISNNGGSSWQTVENVTENAGAWVTKSFTISSLITPTNTMKIRFIASDLGEGAVVEAAIDLLVVGGVACDDAPICIGDLTGDGLVAGDDIGLLLALWGSADPNGDFDEDGSVGGGDLGLLLSGWGFCP
jgi:subtilisin family serine protease